MTTTPVKELVFVDPRLSEPVSVSLPSWEELPAGTQKIFDQLDSNDDGKLAYTANQDSTYEGPLPVDIRHTDYSAETLFRALWAFRGDHPFNNRRLDEDSKDGRAEAILHIQKKVRRDVVPVILSDRLDEKQWEEVKRILVTVVDYQHLYESSEELQALWNHSNDRKFLVTAVSFLMEARRLAAAVEEGRNDWMDKIDEKSSALNQELDDLDKKEFSRQIEHPYLFPTTGNPVTMDIAGASNEGEIPLLFRVSVPRKKNSEEFLSDEEVLSYYRTHPAYLRSSPFKEISSGEKIPLTPRKVDSGEGEDKLNQGSGSSLYLPELENPVFFGTKERKEFWVTFSLPADKIPSQQKFQKYDLLLEGPSGPTREIPGAVVLTDRKDKPVRFIVAADLHIAERDYDVRKTMLDSLKEAVQEGDSSVPEDTLARVERFYRSVNENAEAAVQLWNEAYREGKIDFVVLAGDLVDYINVSPQTEVMGVQSYRSTNFHRLHEILSKLEAPVYMKPGNHDHHILPYAFQDRKEGFADNPKLYELFPEHLDRHIFKHKHPHYASLKGLNPKECNNELSCLNQIGAEIMRAKQYTPDNAGLHSYYNQFESSPADVREIADNHYLFFWDTGVEDFNYKKFLLEDAHAPLLRNARRAFRTYVNWGQANGEGPRPETFVFFLKTVEEVQKKGEHMTVVEHYPPFFPGIGPDNTPDSADALKGDVNWALRLACWYYRGKDGGPVIDAVISGHVHEWGEFVSTLDRLSKEKQEALRGKLKRIFSEKDPETIYDEINKLRHKYQLDSRPNNPPVLYKWEDGFPGEIVSDFNKNSRAFSQKEGTLFVNLPAIGQPKGKEPVGWLEMTINPDGTKEILPHYFTLEPDGAIVHGENFHEVSEAHWINIEQWNGGGQEEKPTLLYWGSFVRSVFGIDILFGVNPWLRAEPDADIFPLIAWQYPKRFFGLIVDWNVLGLAYDSDRLRFNSGITPAVGFSFTRQYRSFPHSLFRPNYLMFGARYAFYDKEWIPQLELGLGRFNPELLMNSDYKFGAGIRFETAFPFLSAQCHYLPGHDQNPTFECGIDLSGTLISAGKK